MARQLNRLSVKKVANTTEPGLYADGGGLYLQVRRSQTGEGVTKSWIFRFELNEQESHMGLGAFNAVSLARAREKAADARSLLADRINPLNVKRAQKAHEAAERAGSKAFEFCAKGYIDAHRVKWKNPKHISQWENTLKTYCAPIATLPVSKINTPLVLECLEPIWTAKHETATRLRQRIEAVLDWATTRGYRTGENPARWKGHLDQALPAIPKKKRVKHHPALPFAQVGNFIETLRTQEGTAARTLEFTILTASRTGEVIGARPEEFDLDAELWTVPANRMKAGREHRVPLSKRAVELVCEQLQSGEKHVFQGMFGGDALSNMAMLMLLKRMGREDLTVHGFRSTFRDWCAESTNYPREVCEMALAHTIADQTEAAYRRGDLLEVRRRLMADWARFCEQRGKGAVVPIRKKEPHVAAQ